MNFEILEGDVRNLLPMLPDDHFQTIDLGRQFVGIEINPEYAAMSRRRIGGPLFAEANL